MFLRYTFAPRFWRTLVRNPVFQSLIAYTAIIFALILPTLRMYMWWGHDQSFPVIRVYEVCKVWRVNGPCHTPWAPDWAFGYGYPFHTFYPPLGYYVGALFHFVLGLDYGPAVKMSFYSSLYLSGAFMYALVYVIGRREGWPRLAWWALGAATVFALTRYHLTDLFVREDLAESWAWPMIAGLFVGVEIARQRPRLGIIFVAVTYAGLILSHNITALYGTIAIALYTLLTISGKRWLLSVVSGGALGTAMATFFWLPAVTLLKLTNAGLPARTDATPTITSPALLHLHALYWQQHFFESLGTQGSIAGPNDALGINLGIAILIGIVLAAIALFRSGLSKGQRYRLGVCLALVALCLFVMSRQMNWSRVPAILRFVQFPWRLLIFTALFGCLATAIAAPILDKWLHPSVWAAVAIVLAIPTLPCILTRPGLLTDWGTTDRVLRWYARREKENWYGGNAPQEFWPLSVKAPLTDSKFLYNNPPPDNRLTAIGGEISVQNYDHKGTAYTYRYTAASDVTAEIAVVYFPGWELRIDGQKQPDKISMSDKGLVRLRLPAGAHTAELRYGLSPLGRIAQKISYLGWAVWAALTISLALRRWSITHWTQRWSQHERTNSELCKSLRLKQDVT